MDLGRVIGTVWATQKDPQLIGLKMLMVQPVAPDLCARGTPIIAVDSVGAGVGEIVYYITSYEAVIPLDKQPALSDATIVGIVDKIELTHDAS